MHARILSILRGAIMSLNVLREPELHVAMPCVPRGPCALQGGGSGAICGP